MLFLFAKTLIRHKLSSLYIFYNVVKNILSERVKRIVNSLPKGAIQEIRMTVGAPLSVTINGESYFSNVLIEKEDVDYTLSCVTRNSVYAVNDTMVRGFITYSGGIRVGIAGEFVYASGNLRTVKCVNSIVLRVPNNVYGIADKLIEKIAFGKTVKNVLLVGPPFSGKTTLLREISRVLSVEKRLKVVIIDEKNEISATYDGKRFLDVGYSTVCVGSTRSDGIENAIRNLSPEVLITDEIYGREDRECVERCLKSGIGVITSMHGKELRGSGIESCFDLYVGLSGEVVGKIEWIKERND